jgi:NAD(P)-dependent dehydrogenase (short-subunit alcohol dehydrogenase family)
VTLAGKVVVVTGAGSGIGRATALAFAAAGARIAACDIDAARVAALGRELGARALVAERVDVSDRAQMAAFAAAVHAGAPAADVVVNNAGVACGGDFLDTSLDDWEWLLGVNLRGVVHGCHFFLPEMVARGAGGHVINISSIFGVFAPPQAAAYTASKFAVLGLSQSLRAELAPHRIGVTAICPGMIATSIVDDSRISGALRRRAPQISATFRRGGAHPDIVARAILDAVRTNPAIRPVGRDAWAIYALTRVAPSATRRLGALLTRRFGAAG